MSRIAGFDPEHMGRANIWIEFDVIAGAAPRVIRISQEIVRGITIF